jgi:hypothetical protein
MENQIRVKLNYSRLSPTEVATQAVAVVDGLTNNPNFTTPPIAPADLTAQVEIYVSLIAAARDGGKRAIIERDKQQTVVVKMLRQLGHWVEANCKDDPGILKSAATVKLPSTVRRLRRSPVRHRSSSTTDRTAAR